MLTGFADKEQCVLSDHTGRSSAPSPTPSPLLLSTALWETRTADTTLSLSLSQPVIGQAAHLGNEGRKAGWMLETKAKAFILALTEWIHSMSWFFRTPRLARQFLTVRSTLAPWLNRTQTRPSLSGHRSRPQPRCEETIGGYVPDHLPTSKGSDLWAGF